MTVQNWRQYLTKLSPDFLRGTWGDKFVGVLGLYADTLAERLTQAHRSGYVTGDQLADDSLRLVGIARALPKYTTETMPQYQARLSRAWKDWIYAGTEASIIGQLEAAGYTGATVIFDDAEPGPRGESAPYWSQFWIGIPSSDFECVTARWGSVAWGSFAWGSSATIPKDDLDTIFAIVRKFKPCDWYFRGIRFT